MEMGSQGVSWLGDLDQLCTTGVSSWARRMGYDTGAEKQWN